MLALATLDGKVVGEAGKVFSTDPSVAMGVDGKTYFVKGCNNSVAFSEVVGCKLAALTGLLVPNATLCVFGEDVYGGVEEVPRAQRDVYPWLKALDRINNPEDLYNVIVVDTWLVNDDRNMGNIVGSSSGGGRVDLFMIDFEKSKALGPSPFMSSSVAPSKLWPTAELGSILRAVRPRRCPGGIIQKIKTFSEQQIASVIEPAAQEMDIVNWHESSVELLLKRAGKIDELAEAVWVT